VIAIGRFTLRYVDLSVSTAPGDRSPAEQMFRWPPDIETAPSMSVGNYLDAVNAHDVARVVGALSPSYYSASLWPEGDAQRREDVAEMLERLFEACADFRVQVRESWQLGSEFHVCLDIAGTFLNQFDRDGRGSLAANARFMELKNQAVIFRTSGGRVSTIRWPGRDDAWAHIDAMVGRRGA
jgi:hypothetical protein